MGAGGGAVVAGVSVASVVGSGDWLPSVVETASPPLLPLETLSLGLPSLLLPSPLGAGVSGAGAGTVSAGSKTGSASSESPPPQAAAKTARDATTASSNALCFLGCFFCSVRFVVIVAAFSLAFTLAKSKRFTRGNPLRTHMPGGGLCARLLPCLLLCSRCLRIWLKSWLRYCLPVLP